MGPLKEGKAYWRGCVEGGSIREGRAYWRGCVEEGGGWVREELEEMCI